MDRLEPTFVQKASSFMASQSSFTSEILTRITSKDKIPSESSFASSTCYSYDEASMPKLQPFDVESNGSSRLGTEWCGYIFETVFFASFLGFVWWFFGVRMHDAFLVFAASLEFAAFVVLLKRLLCSQSAYGVSLQSLYLFCVGLTARAFCIATEWLMDDHYTCYGPEPGFWGSLYTFVNMAIVPLVFYCTKIVRSSRARDSQFDKLPVWPLAIAGLFFAMMTHTSCHQEFLVNLLFMSSHWWVGFAFVPQLVYFDLRGMMERTTSYYMMLIIAGHFTGFLVWLENIVDVLWYHDDLVDYGYFCMSLLAIQAMSILASFKVINAFFRTWNEEKMTLNVAV